MAKFRRRSNGNGKKAVAKLSKKVNKLIAKVEIKENYVTFSDQAWTATDEIFILNGMLRGVLNGQRVGEKIYMKNLEIRIRSRLADSALVGSDSTQPVWTLAYNQQAVRVILIMDKQNNQQAGLVIGQILQNFATQAEKITSVYDYKFVDSKNQKIRFRILYDRVHILNQNGSRQDLMIKINRRLNHKVNYNDGNAGTGGDIVNNALRLLMIPEFSVGIFDLSAVLKYTDS